MLDLGLALFLTVIAAGVGKRLLASVGELPGHPLEALALATPVGMGLLALGCLGLGELGWLNLTGLSVLVAVTTEVGLLAGFRLVREALRGGGTGTPLGPTGRLDWILLAFLVATLGATALAALAPVTDGDALCYHLQVPKIFLIRQAVYFDPDLHETVYPLVTELLYAVALEFRGPVACRCLQWALGLVFAANVAAMARPTMGRRAWWAATFALLVPAVSNGMSAPLNDVALAAFGTAAILAFTRMLDHPSRASTLVAGLCCGLALGVKYPALVLAGVLTLAVLLRPLLDPRWRRRVAIAESLSLAAGFLAATVLVGGAWYLRAYVHTGNPVFPFFKGLFGGAGLDEVLASVKRPLVPGPWSLLTALVPLTLEPERFDSFAHQFGPAFLLFLPALFVERTPRRVVGLAALGYTFLVLCLTQRQSMRFLLIALGPMSVAVAYLAQRWSERATVPARFLTLMLVLVLGSETCLSMTRAARAAGTVLGRESFHQFLGRCEPTYRVGRWVAGHLPQSARLIGQDHRGFYIPRGYTMELAHRRRTGLGAHGESPRDIVRALKGEGFTHVMLCPPAQAAAIEFDPTLGRLLSSWLATHIPLFREDLTDPDGVMREYAIYELCDEELDSRPSEKRAPMSHCRPTIAELVPCVQKGQHREIGNWLARTIARPSAVYGTWVAIRLGLSAHQVTVAALLASLAGAVAIGTGSRVGFILGVAALHLGFWLDHVDGQVARWRRSVSLDGVYLDYLMHHAINGALGFALGYGLARRLEEPAWAVAGFLIALGWALLTLHNDCRYKAFFQRLKSARGCFLVEGGSGGKPAPPSPWPRGSLGALSWPALKACEPHVVLLTLTGLAAVAAADPELWQDSWVAGVAGMAALAPTLGAARIARAVARGSNEDEFARWFQNWDHSTRNDPGCPMDLHVPLPDRQTLDGASATK